MWQLFRPMKPLSAAKRRGIFDPLPERTRRQFYDAVIGDETVGEPLLKRCRQRLSWLPIRQPASRDAKIRTPQLGQSLGRTPNADVVRPKGPPSVRQPTHIPPPAVSRQYLLLLLASTSFRLSMCGRPAGNSPAGGRSTSVGSRGRMKPTGRRALDGGISRRERNEKLAVAAYIRPMNLPCR